MSYYADLHAAGVPVEQAPQDFRDYVFGSIAPDGVAAPFSWRLERLPDSIDLFEDIDNQGGHSSCVGEAWETGLEVFLRARGVEAPRLSPAFIYYNARDRLASMFKKPVEDAGTSTFTAAASLTKQGVCLESLHSYDHGINTKPSDEAYKDGLTRLLGRYERVGRQSWNNQTGETINRDPVADAMVALACGCPVVYCIPLSNEFYGVTGPLETHPKQWSPGRINQPPGNHAMLLTGYVRTDSGVLFVGPNSWGKGWGDNGMLGLSDQQLRSAFDLFTPRSFMGVHSDVPMDLYRWNDGTVEGQAHRLYVAALGRQPEKEGLIYQAQAIKDHGIETVANHFLASPEFQRTYGALDDEQFIQALYRNVLGREGEAGGVRYHLNRLADGTRAQVLIGFSESPENREK